MSSWPQHRIDAIITRLKADNPKAHESQRFLQKLTCPACHKDEAFAYLDGPGIIICSRSNQCGERFYTKGLYPDLFEFKENKYRPTNDDPLRPIEIYLKEHRSIAPEIVSKLIDKRLVGHGYRNIERNKYGYISFILDDGIFNGRMLNPPPGTDKGYSRGKIGGKLFGVELIVNWNDEIYLTEGVFDALSLMSVGKQALSYLSSGYRPDFTKIQATSDTRFVIAPDNDEAGLSSIPKVKQQLLDANIDESQIEICLPKKGSDWNEMLQSNQLDEEALENGKKWGKLQTAKSQDHYCQLYFEQFQDSPRVFEYSGCTFYGAVTEKNNVLEIKTSMIADFILRLEYQILDNEINNPNNKFLFCLKQNHKRAVKFIAEPSDLIEGARTFFFKKAAAIYSATSGIHIAFLRYVMKQERKVVRQQKSYGHDSETQGFFTPHYGIHKGKVVKPNKDGIFELGTQHLLPFQIEMAFKYANPDLKKIYNTIVGSFGDSGRVALSWSLASLFRWDFIEKYGFFPFYSMHGDHGTGKSTLAKTLSRIRGIDNEGQNITKGFSTQKAIARKVSQLNSTHFALLECNDSDKASFDFNSILTWFNKGAASIRARYSNDNQTQEEQMNATLMFVQNREQFYTPALKSRIISTEFKKGDFEDTRVAYQNLQKISKEELAGFGCEILIRSDEIVKAYGSKYENTRSEFINQGISDRIAEVHAVIVAFYDTIIREIFELDERSIKSLVLGMAKKKEVECKSDSNAHIQLFRELLLNLKENSFNINEDIKGELILGKLCESDGQECYAIWFSELARTEHFKALIKSPKDLRDELQRSDYYIKDGKAKLGSKSQHCIFLKTSFLEDEELEQINKAG